MDVNDDTGCLDKRSVWALFASRLAPTRGLGSHGQTVGASLLAMDVNDDAACLDKRGVRAFFAGSRD
jgi:hypothetical protein